MELLNTKRKIKTIFHIFMLFFMLSSFLLLMNTSLPDLFKAEIEKGSSIWVFIIKNYMFIFISIALSFILSILNIKINYTKYILIFYIFITIILSSLTYFIGVSINGAKRWIKLPFIQLQPSEFLKISIIILAAVYIVLVVTETKEKINRLKKFMKNPKIRLRDQVILHLELYSKWYILLLFYISLVTVAIGKAFTNTALLFLLFNLLLLFSKENENGKIVDIKYIVLNFVVLILGLVLLLISGKLSHVFNRFNGIKEQVVKSHSLFSLGGLTGTGLNNTISKSMYISENNSDYFLATIGESFGFVGVVILITILISFAVFLYKISENSNDILERCILQGFSFIVLNQTVLHLFVTTGNISTGVLLPFYGAGGSSSIVFSMLILMATNSINKLNVKDR